MIYYTTPQGICEPDAKDSAKTTQLDNVMCQGEMSHTCKSNITKDTLIKCKCLKERKVTGTLRGFLFRIVVVNLNVESSF